MKRLQLGAAALLLLVLLPLSGCTEADDDTAPTPEPCDNETEPTLLVQAVENGQPASFPVQVLAQANDPEGIGTVTLYYRSVGAPTFQFTFMSNEATGQADIYAAEIPGDSVVGSAVEYYVRATDQLVPCTEEVFWPEPGEDAPATFTVRAEVLALPFLEPFEAAADQDLEDLLWSTVELSFPQAEHSFRLDDRGPLSGEWCVGHSEGVPGGFWLCPDADPPGPERQNWLISPPLDLRVDTGLALRFFEREVDGWTCDELHQVWISTGSPDPLGGDWQLVSDVVLPGEAWQPSPWYDLSAYIGAEKAYIGFYYQGGAAGRWMIDDVYVGEPLASLELAQATPGGPVLEPGADDVTLTVSVRNSSAVYGAEALEATLSTTDPQVHISSPTTTFAAVGPGATVAGAAAFVFDVSPAHVDNARIDFALELTDAAGHHWAVPIRLLMGEPSEFTLSYDAGGGASLSFELGHGPPAAPAFVVGESSGSLAGAPWVRDVTDQAQQLPPGGGDNRWYLKVSNDGVADGTITGMTLRVGGVEHMASATPVIVPTNEERTIFLPDPTVLVVDGFDSEPSPAAPGEVITLDNLSLRNDGYPTGSDLSCVLDSPDADVTVISTAPVSFPGPILQGGAAVADGPFEFEIAASHTDATAVDLALICIDGVDAWAIPFAVDVPFAHPSIVGALLDDGDGDWDDEDLEVDFADAGDVVEVLLSVENDGAFAFSGPLSATVATGTGSTATFTLGGGAITFGGATLAPGEGATADAPFEIAVDAAAMLGDRMVLDITFDDGAHQWVQPYTVEVSGRPWTECNTALDPQGDNLGASTFDIKGCAFRSDGDMLQLRLDAWQAYTTPNLSLWAFFYEVPNQYTLEHVPPGTPDLEYGCVAQDQDVPLSTPILVDRLSDSSVSVRVATGDLGILASNTQVAFGTEYCAGVWWCDVYPDFAVQYSLGSVGCNDFLYVPIFW